MLEALSPVPVPSGLVINEEKAGEEKKGGYGRKKGEGKKKKGQGNKKGPGKKKEPGKKTIRKQGSSALKQVQSRDWVSFRGVVANVLDYAIVVDGFELQSFYYVHFYTNPFRKSMIHPSYVLNITTSIILRE